MTPFADIINAACTDPKHAILLGSRNFDDRAARTVAQQVRALLRSSRRFVIDDEVVRAACRLGIQHPKVLFEMLQRARTPFDKIWLEWPLAAQIEEAGQILSIDAPSRCGVFVERLDQAEPLYRMTNIGAPARDSDENHISVAPISTLYNLRDPFISNSAEYERIVEISKLPREFVAMSVLGRAYALPDDDDPEEAEERQQYCDALSSHATYMLNPISRNYIQQALDQGSRDAQFSIATAIRETSGQWRLVVALLALMNAQDFIERGTYRAGRNRMVRATVVPYLEHVTVKLKLPRHIVQDRLVREYVEAIPRRRHEVMGHWKHSRKHGDSKCNHAFVDVTAKRQRCALCSFTRWWVNEHERGDASLGYVTKDRLVTRS